MSRNGEQMGLTHDVSPIFVTIDFRLDGWDWVRSRIKFLIGHVRVTSRKHRSC